MNSNYFSEYLFDHLVVIGRDRLEELSRKFLNDGFQLTPKAYHNLGSMNQLIMFDSSYIELLGWDKGEAPKRIEIANQPIGLDAIVFRTNNANECFQRLQHQGFLVNPVQELSRECEYNNKTVLVQFKTVRFLEQPIPGLRIYFCEHLTPNYVWQSQWLKHDNQISCLKKINITTDNVQFVTRQMNKLLNFEENNSIINKEVSQIILSNIKICVHSALAMETKTEISSVSLSRGDQDPVDLTIDKHFFNQF